MPRTEPAPSRRLLIWFLLITGAPLLAAGGLAWWVIRQDRDLERQRLQERRERAADLAAASLQRLVAELEEQLSTLASAASPWAPRVLPSGVAAVRIDAHGVQDHAGTPLLYVPSPVDAPPVPALFATADALEFRHNDPAGAIRALAPLVRSRDTAVRAEALECKGT